MNDIEHLTLTVLTALACPLLLPMIIEKDSEKKGTENQIPFGADKRFSVTTERGYSFRNG